MKKRTNSLGPGKINVSTTVPKWLDDEIKRLAKKTGITRNKYVLALIEDAARHHTQVTEKTLTNYEIRSGQTAGSAYICQTCGKAWTTQQEADNCCR